ncbi:MAG: hypothetical protein Q9168_006809, partial [Polycauliona sp. 1 TL-2023]
MLLEHYPVVQNHCGERKTYNLDAIASIEDTKWLCPIHYVYDYLPSPPKWLQPPPLSSNPLFPLQKQQEQESCHLLEKCINSITLHTQSANLPLHTGLTGPFLQNKHWKATEESTREFLGLFARDERCGRLLLANNKSMANLAEEQLAYSDIMDSYSRFTIYFWPGVDEHRARLLAQSMVFIYMLD